MAITKQDLIDNAVKSSGLNRIDVRLAVEELLFNTIPDLLIKGKKIEIRGFGTLQLKKHKAKTSRNPKTGERVMVPERRVPVMRFSQEVKDQLNKLSVVTVEKQVVTAPQ